MDDRLRTDGSGLTRRTVLQGAAWSAPVVALAAAAPLAAASTGAITVSFAVLAAELHWEDVFAGVVSITNDSDVDIDGDSATLELTGFPENDELELSYPPSATQVQNENDAQPTPVQNSAFVVASAEPPVLVLTSGSFSLARGETVTIAFLLTRPAFNPVVRVFVIAGRFTLGSGAVATVPAGQQLEITLPDD